MVELDVQASGTAANAAAAAASSETPDDGASYGAVASALASVEAAGDALEASESDDNDALRVRLKLLDERVVDVAAARSMSVASFREAVARATQLPAARQRLIYRGKLLKDGAALAAYGIRDGHTVHVVAKPIAGATPPDAAATPLPALAQPSRPTTRRRSPGPGDPTGTAWNMGVLREALGDRVARDDPEPAPTRLHGLRELFGSDVLEDATSPASVAAEMGLAPMSSNNSSSSSSSTPTGVRQNLDHILQGMMTLRTVLSTAALPANEAQQQMLPSEALELQAERAREREMSFEDFDAPPRLSSSPTRRGRRRFFVGQWLDVKDTVNQWLECTVMAISDDKVLVHYHGWPSRWDEWLDFDSDRIAAFRTRTVHTVTSSHLSPTPATRLPNAPSVGGHDVRVVVGALRDLLREMTPHVERFAALCEEEEEEEEEEEQQQSPSELLNDGDTTSPAPRDVAARRAAELSEMAHFMAPVFDRFGRVLADSAHCLEPLLAPELRSYNQERQAQQARAAAMLMRGRSSARQPASPPSALAVRDTSLGVRDLISSAMRAPAEAPPARRNIDVHIHAILAPSSLQSFASLARAASSNGALQESAPPTRRLRAPQTSPFVAGPDFDEAFGLPSLRDPLGGSDGRSLVNDEADDSDPSESVDHSRRPLLGSFRRRDASSLARRRRTVDENLVDFFADDFVGSSFGNDSDELDDANDSAAPANSRSPTRSSEYRSLPPPNERNGDEVASGSSTTLGVIPEIAAAEERERARESTRVGSSTEERVRGDSSASSSSSMSSSASSASSSGSSYPSFLEFMRRSLRRNFGFTPQREGPREGESESITDLPALESPPSSPSRSSSSSSSSLSSMAISASPAIARRESNSSSSSISSIEEDEEMDQVD